MKTVCIKISFFFLLIPFFTLTAQNEFSKWYFGQQAGLDFATSPPTILTNGAMNASEGCASISDNAGNILFYTNGAIIYNSQHTLMANGSGIVGDVSSTQSSIIVKQPGSNSIYYLMTTRGTSGFVFSTIDMSLAAGLGSVTVKNATLYPQTCEKQVAVSHCNGRDIWIVSHEYNSNNFRSYLLNATGINPNPVISSIGQIINNANINSAVGQLKISPDGKKLAMALTNTVAIGNPASGGFHLFDFDASSGIVSNSLAVSNSSIAYGVEFSPDGTKLYGTSGFSSSTPTLFQWNICLATNTAIVASQYSITLNAPAAALQRAIDDKIYLSALSMQSLSVINNPNASGAAMNLVIYGQSIAPKSCGMGLPNNINTYARQSPAPFTSTFACQTVSYSIPSVPTFSSGCTSTPYAPYAYLWDFGEPTVGAANTSTLTYPVHTYSTIGAYSVTLIIYSNCTNDTLKKVITISTPGPSINVTGVFEICKGDKRTYTVTGASTYVWSNNTTSTTATFSPVVTTTYSVTGTATNGCSASKSFTANVNPCLGIITNEQNLDLRVYPNPVKDLLTIESAVDSQLLIFDVDGTLMLEHKVNSGLNELNTTKLKPGVYFIRSENSSGIWRGRLIKIE